MTPTSDERREVAARLRKCGAELSILGADCETGFHVVDKIIGCREEDSWERFLARLADLIDPTCTAKLKRVVVDEHYRNTRFIPTCSVCGSPLDGGIGIPRFCPGCGARRVPRKVTH